MKKEKNMNDEIRTAKQMPRRVEKKTLGIIKSEKDLEKFVENVLEAKATFVSWGETMDHNTATACLVIKPNVMASVASMARIGMSLNAIVCMGPLGDKIMLLGLSW